ncbi:rhodanese-like domain-containing protein [Aquirufa aurantiipilula]|uniref:Rhodanese-like domain-containing protein n=1 Tax=Aquirufa aurantiipilula TaxID=2696561 RepID=A0ABT6BMH5_9BACT|nr:rhodanese-like domain-containing protein [Aquirufa aurantiipilula]MBZ1327575.1 rhodanese-like domain-containing protein [Aquirufa aurantiipilula]MDF5691682.1 rhodanese-like domain-containing protein [Aquirufa aurantiipilula]
MLEFLKNLLGFGPKVDLATLIKAGAKIVDVRTPAEYQQGHVKGSLNLPLQTLPNNLSKLKKEDIIITCCASGMRSGAAKRLLKSYGFQHVHNGGTWKSLE